TPSPADAAGVVCDRVAVAITRAPPHPGVGPRTSDAARRSPPDTGNPLDPPRQALMPHGA
ncbi:hypothetical protein, partial [Streptomyces sp. SID12501]|uniref:hypothetical protein n=1 Tax=Streptomyces sp. SID12501 TaxID=2706042 RepID=UPI0019437388